MSFYIRKASGRKELFDVKKFRKSLTKSGADARTIKRLVKEVEQMALTSTKAIYEYALAQLHEDRPAIAARYNIKRALFELGPAGFSFEQFVGELFKEQGYKIAMNPVVRGWCVEHELDVVAQKNNTHLMIECKFHNRQGLKSDLKVPLYIKARFDDVKKAWEQNKNHKQEFHEVWLATNTRFTSQAIAYGECAGIKMLSWSYPKDNNIPTLITKHHLHPITALVSLSRKQKKQLIKEGFVLCRDAQEHTGALKRVGLRGREVDKLVAEAQEVCHLAP